MSKRKKALQKNPIYSSSFYKDENINKYLYYSTNIMCFNIHDHSQPRGI